MESTFLGTAGLCSLAKFSHLIFMLDEKETILLETLHKMPTAGGQRDLARTIGLSLGMTNVLLKKLIQRGWVIVRHLSARKLQYALTTEGMRELSKRSFRYLKKTVKQIADYRKLLVSYVKKQKEQGYQGILLIGQTELDFLVEAVVQQEGLAFKKISSDRPPELTGWSILFSEEETQEPNLFTLTHQIGEYFV